MKEKYIKSKKAKISYENEDSKKDFSFWVKEIEKENQTKYNCK